MKADEKPYRLPADLFVWCCPFCFEPVDPIGPARAFPHEPSRPAEPSQFDVRVRMHQRCADAFDAERARLVVGEARKVLVWECRSRLN